METPKNSAKASRENPKEECRFCKTKLVIKYGKTAYISTENIFAVSKRKEYSDKPEFRGLENKASSQLCAELGFNVAKSDKLSDRICKPCGRSLRSTYCFYKRLKSVEENDSANAEASDKKTTETERGVNEGKCSDAPNRFKRQLPTTISPDRCTISKAAKRSSGAKKSLAFGQEKENLANVDAHLNIESLLDKPTTQVKTVIVYPNGNVECRSSFSQESASIIINISKRNWKTVANTIFKHEEIKAELLGPITKAVDAEFADYCKDSRKSILLAKSPAEVGQFSNAKFLEECAVSCPFWTASLKGANGVKRKSDETLKIANSMALSTAAAARARNHKMSALAYRISTILFHSGTKWEDIDRLSKLGICMSPESIVAFQTKMGGTCRVKLFAWKSEIEKRKTVALALKKVLEHATDHCSSRDLQMLTETFCKETSKKKILMKLSQRLRWPLLRRR